MTYTKNDLAVAMELMWELLERRASKEELQELRGKHSAINEIYQFGAGGPVGIGLGNMGGHAIE